MGSPPTLDPGPTRPPAIDQDAVVGDEELLEHPQTPAAFGGHEVEEWPPHQIAGGFGGDLDTRHRHDHTRLANKFTHTHPDLSCDPVREAERAFDGLNPDYGVPADQRSRYGREAVRDREAALALGVRVAVHDSRQNDPNPVIWQSGQDYRMADALHAARTQPTRTRSGAGAGRPRTLNQPAQQGAHEMAADNHTTIVGNLVDDPELRFTNNGIAVTNLRVAVTQRVQQDGQWRDGETSFFKVNVWRGQAEHLADSLGKGDRVMVTGRLRQRSWETPEGDKRSVTELEADEVGARLKWATAKVERAQPARQRRPQLRAGNGRPSAVATSMTVRPSDHLSIPACVPGCGRGRSCYRPTGSNALINLIRTYGDDRRLSARG